MELPIVKIIKKGVGCYKFGEVVEVNEPLSEKLIEEGAAVEASRNQLQKWETYLLAKKVRDDVEDREQDSLKYNKIKLDNYMDNAAHFYISNPYFYDEVGIFWFWDKVDKKYVQKDEVDLMSLFDDILGMDGQTVSGGLKSNYLEAFKRVGRKHKPKPSPVKWIQFKDGAYSLTSKLFYSVNHDYFFTNPIPHRIGESTDTPTMDKLFNEWVGEKYVKTLYEIVAYCCYTSYPIQVLFCLYGNGRNGKTCFIRLLNRFIGQDNTTSTELDTLLTSRFESFKLYKKLVCMVGETNFGIISKTSLLKKLVGGDLIGFEKKGKDPFDGFNYAKILIASNSLPSTQDTSEGFYRRWLIIDFPNQFPEGKDILESIPEHEYGNLANKVTQILPTLLRRGAFTNQGDTLERKEKYILASNPLPIFVKACCDVDEEYFSLYSELYTAYVKFLNFHKKRRVKMAEFKQAMEDEGYWMERTSKELNGEFRSARWVTGINLKYDWKENLEKPNDTSVLYDSISTSSHEEGNRDRNNMKNDIKDTTKKEDIVDLELITEELENEE